jgi:hypothetical protein
MNRHSPYAICTWIRVSEDLQRADCRKLEGDEFAIWNGMFNKEMHDLPK